MATLLVAIVASVALIRKIANLVVVALRHLVAEFVFCTKLDLLLTLLRERAVGHLQVVDVVEILGDGLECFVAEASSALEVPGAVLLMKGRVEPLNFECVVGRGHVPHRKGFDQAKHLFEPAKMIDWLHHHHFLEDVVSTRLKIDVLPIPRLFLVQRQLKKEQDCLTKVFVQVAILIPRDWPRPIDRLREVLVERLLPSSPVLSLEHIFELRKGVDPGEFAFLYPLIELRDRLIDCELDGVTSIILMDFGKVFVFGIVATQLVDFRQGVVVVPFFFSLVERGALVDGCHRVVLVALWVQVSFYPCFARSL